MNRRYPSPPGATDPPKNRWSERHIVKDEGEKDDDGERRGSGLLPQPHATPDDDGVIGVDFPSLGSVPNLDGSRTSEMDGDRDSERTTIERVRRSPHEPPSPTLDMVFETVLRINRSADVEMQPEDIVFEYAKALEDLFPERLFVVRLVDPSSGVLRLVYATDRLKEGRGSYPEVTREAMARHSLIPASLEREGVVMAEEYGTVSDSGRHGFDVPLMNGERLMGVLGIEYADQVVEPSNDRAHIVPMGLQMAAVLP